MFNRKLEFKLEKLRNNYKNKSAILFGNGPSISDLDFEILKKNKNIITLTTNLISDICKRNNWYPNIYGAFFCEPLRGKEYQRLFKKNLNYPGTIEQALYAQDCIKYLTENQNVECFLHCWYKNFLTSQDNINFVKPILWNRFKNFPKDAFQKYEMPNKFLWHNATTVLYQLSFYFKFKNIAIIGQDGYQLDKECHFENYKGPKILKDINYMKKVNLRIEKLLDAVEYSSKIRNINVFDLSQRSIFKHFPKIKLDQYLKII